MTGQEIWKAAEKANKLCFSCYYSAGGCSWTDKYIPVPGSVTEPGKYDSWVHIIECPQYKEGDRLWSPSKANASGSSSTS